MWCLSGVTLPVSADQVPGHLDFGTLKVVEGGGMPGAGGGGAVLEEGAQGDVFAIWAGVGCRVLHRETGCKRSLGCLGQ